MYGLFHPLLNDILVRDEYGQYVVHRGVHRDEDSHHCEHHLDGRAQNCRDDLTILHRLPEQLKPPQMLVLVWDEMEAVFVWLWPRITYE